MSSVLIVGSGPVGLLAACELRRRGISCRVIDKSAQPTNPAISKAVAVHAKSVEILEDLGVVEHLLENGVHVNEIVINDSSGEVAKISFEKIKEDTKYDFVLCLPQGVTESILTSKLAELGTHIERNVSLQSITQFEDEVEVELEISKDDKIEVEKSKFKYIIGADGAHSTVRHQLAIEFEGSPYSENFSLADVSIDWDVPHNIGSIYLSQEYFMAVFPLPIKPSYYRVVLDNLAAPARESSGEVSHGISGGELKLETIQEILKKFKPDAKVHSPGWLTNFNASRRLAKRYRVNRVFLAGDAAHIHSPAGGQGMNTGFQDVANLTWKLALVLNGQSPASILDTYEIERRYVAQSVLTETDFATRILTLKSPLLQTFRNKVLGVISSFDVVQEKIGKTTSMVGVNYTEAKSPIIVDRSATRFGTYAKVVPGARLPNKLLSDGTRLYEKVLGPVNSDPKFKLLLLLSSASDPNHPIYKDAERMALQINHRYSKAVDVSIVLPKGTQSKEFEGKKDVRTPIHLIYDGDGTIANLLGVEGEQIVTYVIRPDAYVGLFVKSFNPDDILGYFETALLVGEAAI